MTYSGVAAKSLAVKLVLRRWLHLFCEEREQRAALGFRAVTSDRVGVPIHFPSPRVRCVAHRDVCEEKGASQTEHTLSVHEQVTTAMDRIEVRRT